MPLEIDYKFGKAAVRRGQLRQEQLEECVEVLVALERVGSRKRLWDVILGKGYMTATAIAEVRREAEEPAGDAEPGTPEESLPQGDETAEDLEMPVPEISGFLLAHLTGKGEVTMHALPMRLVVIGKDPDADIVISETGVEDQHAKITYRNERFVIADVGSKAGVIVNDRCVTSHRLVPNDLIELGSGWMLFLAEYGGGIAPQRVGPTSVKEPPAGRLRITDGPQKGTAFFVGAGPLVVGSHELANARLADPQVSGFHAHLACTAQGIRLVDLKSLSGTRVNGLSVTRRILNDGDNISIKSFALSFTALTPSEITVRTPLHAEAEPMDYDVALDVEVDIPSDPDIEAGIKPPPGRRRPEPPPRAFEPGQLQLTCIEGPAEGRAFILNSSRIVIGRGRSADIVLDDPSISRHHAEIRLGKTRTVLRDPGSKNGVFVNGIRTSNRALRSGDTIRIGKSLFIAEEVVSPSKTGRKP